MDIEIERLNIRLGAGFSADRVGKIGGLIEVALEAMLRVHAAEFSTASAGYRISSMALPAMRVSPRSSDDEIAQAVAEALSQSILNELEMRT